jgi:hypothetical protein
MPIIIPDSINYYLDSAHELYIGYRRGHGAKSVNVFVNSHYTAAWAMVAMDSTRVSTRFIISLASLDLARMLSG